MADVDLFIYFYLYFFFFAMKEDHGEATANRTIKTHVLMGEKSSVVVFQRPVRSMSFVQRH